MLSLSFVLSLFQKPSDNHSKAREMIAKVKQLFFVKKRV